MGFGRVTKYWPISLHDIKNKNILSSLRKSLEETSDNTRLLDQTQISENETNLIHAWDEAVEFASCKYDDEDHNLITNNCHAHVSTALNRLQFKGISYWNTVLLMFYLVIYGKFVRYSTNKILWKVIL